jgi:cytochrome P450
LSAAASLRAIDTALASIEAAVLAVAVFQVLVIATKPPLRRDAAAFPLLAATLVLVGLAGAGVAAWAIWRWPAMRHAAAVLTSIALLLAWWRARPAHGKRRGLPPGSLGIARSLDAIDDRTFYLDQARVHGPVFKTSQFGRPVVCVLGLARGRALLAAHPEALAAATLPYNRRLPRGTLRYMAERDHRDEAPLFRNTFATLQLDAGEVDIRESCRETLRQIVEDSTRAAEGVRVREYFAGWLLAALSRVFFGLRPNDPSIVEIDGVMQDLRLQRAGGFLWHQRLERALVRVTELMRRIASDQARSSGRIGGGSALQMFLAAAPGALDDPTRARNLFLAFRISHGDLTGLADWLFHMLTEHSDWQGRVRAAGRTWGVPNGSQPNDLGTRVVLETLRLEQSEYLYRRVAEPVRIGEYAIPAGWLLRICVQESHRDPATFADPDRFDPDRFLGRTYARSEYSPFGADTRGCMGARVAHFLGRVLVEELCAGFTWRVTRTGPPERGSRQRDHWRPSARSRVVMTAAESAPGFQGGAELGGERQRVERFR